LYLEIKSILLTEPKPEEEKKKKTAKFANKKNFEVIEYEREVPEYEHDRDEYIIPSATNFDVSMGGGFYF